jgi:HlyD family secretion protein
MKRALFPLVACLALGIAVGACSNSDAQPGKPAPGAAPGPQAAIKPIPITTARAEARPVQRSVETVGSVLAWEDAQVRTEQPGMIARLLVDLGDTVKRGQVLAEYDTREFELAVRQAEADVLAARQSLSRAKAAVLAAEASLRRAKDHLATLEAEVARTQSVVEWSRSELERTQELARKELVAARDVDSARNAYNIAAAQLAAAQAAKSQHPDQVRQAEAQLESDQAALRVTEAEVTRREATLGIAAKRLGDTTVRSPINGAVARRHINAGEFVKDNTALFTVVALDPLKYTGTVPERFAPELRIGQRVDLSVEAYPGRTFAGQITRVAPAVEVQTRTLAVEGRVPNTDGRLRPGFFAKGLVLTKKDEAIAFVPAEAVLYFVGISKVFVVGNGAVQERIVKAGTRQGSLVEIVEGVKAGETVAISNLSQLFDGAPISLADGRPGR